MKKKIHKLKYIPDYDFTLIGISAHEHDYRLTWNVNKKLGLNLIKINDLEIFNKKLNTQQSFSLYAYQDEDSLLDYHLISNKCENGFLIKELQNLDFFLKITGEGYDTTFINQLVKQLKEADQVISAFYIDNNSIKQPSRFLF
jgi:hypothetical protein